MSINMSNVKSITLGGVSVKKIEDTSGNVLWGGVESKYRKLDYIKFSGNEYVELSNSMWGDQSKFEITFEKYETGTQSFLGDNNNNFDISYSGRYIYCSGNNIYQNLVDNGKYKVTLTSGRTDSSKWTTPISGNVYDYQSGKTTNFSRTLSTNGGLGFTSYIGCRYNLNYYLKGKLYEFNYHHSNTTLTLVPCQRKSDNVCGLYDTTNQKFYPMVGTVITDGARGNVVAENWDVK